MNLSWRMCEYSPTTLASLMNEREPIPPYYRARSTLLKARSILGETSAASLVKSRLEYTEKNEVSNNQVILTCSQRNMDSGSSDGELQKAVWRTAMNELSIVWELWRRLSIEARTITVNFLLVESCWRRAGGCQRQSYRWSTTSWSFWPSSPSIVLN